MRIANNIMALNTHRAYTNNNDKIASSAEKLSTGYRINKAGDDAAGLAISEKMRAQIRGLNMAAKNSQDAISLVQTAEGALQETHNILQRMRELAVQSASDTNEKVIDRGALQQEFEQLREEINDIASKTVFNDQKLIDGTFSSKISSATVIDGDNGGTFASDGGTVILANNVKPGTYNFGVKQVTTGSVVGTKPGDTDFNQSNTDLGAASKIEWTADTNIAMDSDINGAWTVKVDQSTGNISAVNTNGKSFTGTVKLPDGYTTGTQVKELEIEFSGLGTAKLTFEDTKTIDPGILGTKDSVATTSSYLDGIGFSVQGATTPSLGETKFYAMMSGASDVELRVGDTSVTFDNGITLEFGNAINFKDLPIQYEEKAADDGLIHAKDGSYIDGSYDKGLTANGQVTVVQRGSDGIRIQTGANEGDELVINIDRMNASALGLSKSSVATRSSASHALTDITNAINEVSTQRAALGAMQNRLDHKIANLKVSAENLQAAESRIRDVDIASEMTKYTQSNILSQAATAMLAQANSAPQNVLSLLK